MVTRRNDNRRPATEMSEPRTGSNAISFRFRKWDNRGYRAGRRDMTANVSPIRSNMISPRPSSKLAGGGSSTTDRPSSCSNKSLLAHNGDKPCPVHSRTQPYKTIGQCHDKIDELEKQNARLVSKVRAAPPLPQHISSTGSRVEVFYSAAYTQNM